MPRLKHDLLNHLALKSAQEKLRFNSAKARQAEADAPPPVEVNQFGRAIVAYADQPALRDSDMREIMIEFERNACPHSAVAQYRPGFRDSHDPKHARDHWWFYNRGTSILAAVANAPKEILEQISTPALDIVALQGEMSRFLQLERRASLEAARESEMTLRDLESVEAEELADIEAEIGRRFLARILTNAEGRFGRRVAPEEVVIEKGTDDAPRLSDYDGFGI